jgi:oxygen-independent coproporphyrinogen-3 oxidase
VVLALPPLSLYIHIPWCIKKCPYCDFNSHVTDSVIPEADYVRAVIEDLKADLPWVQGRKLHSIFFGGGTPSLFSGFAIGAILKEAEHLIGFEADAEITLEANPGVMDQKNFSDLYAAGVNRLSIGIQSFNDVHLNSLGRIHGSHDALSAIDIAQSSGFRNFNLDLMHGLPNQSIASAINDIEIALNSGASHISWYQLTIEPNTEFFSHPPALPVEDRLAEIQQLGLNVIKSNNYRQYEVSAFAKDRQESRHNVNYWQFGDYLGIGAGAHGKITILEENQLIRTTKTRQPKDYLNRVGRPLARKIEISKEDIVLEFMMNGLRLKAGIPVHYLSMRTGVDEKSIEQKVSKLQSQGLMEPSAVRYQTTSLGYQFLNTVLQSF